MKWEYTSAQLAECEEAYDKLMAKGTYTQEEMELEEVNAQLARIEAERDDLAALAVPLKEKRDALATQVNIAARVATFSDAEKAALFQELRAQGIPSEESVGTPGRVS